MKHHEPTNAKPGGSFLCAVAWSRESIRRASAAGSITINDTHLTAV